MEVKDDNGNPLLSVSDINREYRYSKTYPAFFVIPAKITSKVSLLLCGVGIHPSSASLPFRN